MTKCPECGGKLGANAVRCRCGWSAVRSMADSPKRADCAVTGCGALTLVREKTETGWANFCEHHYIEYHHRKSAKRVREELGLTTVEQMREFCRKRVRGILKPMEPQPEREPEEVNF